MTIVRRVGVLSVGKVLGLVYALLGLIFGAFFTVFAILGTAASRPRGAGAGGSLLIGVGAVIFIPLLYGAIGFVGGVIVAAVYNVVASLVGGIEIELEQPPRVGGFPFAPVR